MKIVRAGALVLVLLLTCAGGLGVHSQPTVPFVQPPEQIYNEMLTVYYGNLARRDNGVPPLRWNAPLTEAARWFDWDSVENRPPGFCGHQDTLGRWPSERVPLFGYHGARGAENCYCGYMLPQDAIDGWMDSPGHRANLLDPNSREIGMGYYRRTSDGRGYLTQDFGHDAVFPPLIIDHEAITTTNTAVDLYIYDREQGGGFAGLGPAVDMQVANEPCFHGAQWESYAAEKAWTLEPGTGWRTVYVKTRDAVGRTTTVSDTIYLGAPVPLADLGLHLASGHAEQVTVYCLDTGWPQVQFSQNWFVDDQFSTFARLWGNGAQVSDPDAKGGTAFRMWPGDGESSAWVWTTEFFKDTPFVAYVRLKVSDNSSADEVARFLVKGGGVEFGPLYLKGTDFAAPDTCQEFPLAFTFHHNPDDSFLILQFWRSGDADVTVDGVTLFTTPQAVQSPLTWTVPGGNYRGGGVWVRYLDGTGAFSAVQEAQPSSSLSVSPMAATWMVEAGTVVPDVDVLSVIASGCASLAWTVSDDAPWLQARPNGDTISLDVDASALAVGTYVATVTVDAGSDVFGSPAWVTVRLLVVDELHRCSLPLVSWDHP